MVTVNGIAPFNGFRFALTGPVGGQFLLTCEPPAIGTYTQAWFQIDKPLLDMIDAMTEYPREQVPEAMKRDLYDLLPDDARFYLHLAAHCRTKMKG